MSHPTNDRVLPMIGHYIDDYHPSQSMHLKERGLRSAGNQWLASDNYVHILVPAEHDWLVLASPCGASSDWLCDV